MGDTNEDISYKDHANKLKDEGNSCFEKGDIEGAIQLYTQVQYNVMILAVLITNLLGY